MDFVLHIIPLTKNKKLYFSAFKVTLKISLNCYLSFYFLVISFEIQHYNSCNNEMKGMEWLKILRNPCCKQMYCHPGCVVAFTKYMQSTFGIMLKDPRIFMMVNEHWC